MLALKLFRVLTHLKHNSVMNFSSSKLQVIIFCGFPFTVLSGEHYTVKLDSFFNVQFYMDKKL